MSSWRKYCAAALVLVTSASASSSQTVPPVNWAIQTTDTFSPYLAPAAEGGVFVGSSFQPPSGAARTTLSHFSSSGTQTWRIVAPAFGDGIRSLQTDALGNLYAVGNAGGTDDLKLRKFTSDGSLVWAQQFGSPISDFSPGFAVAANGTAYVTNAPWASNYGVPPPLTTTTLRQFHPDGTPGWVTNLDPGDGLYPGLASGGRGTAIDRDGNIVSIFSNYRNINQSISGETYISKTSSSGQVQWIRPIGITNRFSAAIDDANDVFVAAHALYKYDGDGALLWTVDTNTLYRHQFFTNCLGPDGTQYLAGQTYLNNDWIGVLAAYDPAGAQLWSTIVNPPPGSKQLFFTEITLSGDRLFAGGRTSTVDANNISRPTGNYIVSMQIPEPAGLLVTSSIACIAVARRYGSRQRGSIRLPASRHQE